MLRPLAPALVTVALAAVAPAGAAAGADSPAPERPRAVILLFDGVQIIDFTGPYEVLGQAGMEVYTASVDGRPLVTNLGLRVTPDGTLADAPPAELLVLPGGRVPHRVPDDDPRLAWIAARHAQGATILSVCNGAFFLASAGLLDGLRATTYAPMLDHLQGAAPRAEITGRERVVDNGRIVTAGGLSAGIDGALHIVARRFGAARARWVANNIEYDWRPDGDYVRAGLADLHIQRVIDFRPPARDREDELYAGDADQWTLRWHVRWPEPAEEMRRQFAGLAAEAGWHARDGAVPGEGTAWTFADDAGRPWAAEVVIAPGAPGQVLLEIRVRRAA